MKINEVVLTELFDKIGDWEWVEQENDLWAARFDVNDNTYDVTIDLKDFDPNNEFWEVDFEPFMGTVVDDTGRYESNQVLATVSAIVKDFVEQNDPERITFSANTGNSKNSSLDRASVYNNMLKKMLPNEYEFSRNPDSNAKSLDHFEIRKKTPEKTKESFNNKKSITEVLDKSFNWKWSKQSGKYNQEALFKSDEYEYTVLFERLRGVWEITFKSRRFFDRDFSDAVQTNEYVASRVLSTVIEIIKDFVAKVEPEKVYFESFVDDLDRGSVYKKILQKELPKEYEVTIKDRSDVVIFDLVKKENF